MQETLFLQFYSRRKSSIYNLLNGFSDTYELCRRHGDFLWMADEPDDSRWYQYDLYAARTLPISAGTIYVSALDVNHLYQCWVWAREYPRIRFIVGGPVAAERSLGGPAWDPAYVRVEDPRAMPPNLTLTGKSVEAWFGVPDFSGAWHLEIPADIPPGGRIYFSYTLDNACFWHRCIYCNVACHDQQHVRRRKKLAYEFRQVAYAGTKLVRLNTGSISPLQLRRLLPDLPRGNGFEYRTFMRPAAAENRALQETLAACDGNAPDLVLGFGVEFPTERMLRYVDKGFGPEDILQGLEVCRANRVLANGNMIVGWDNLTATDVDELEVFMQRVPEGAFKNIQLRWLLAHPYTPIHERYHGRPIRFGPFYEGFSVSLSDPQAIALNRRATDIIAHYAAEKQYKLDGLENVRRHLEENSAQA